jgi:hypothetical protein
MTYPVHFFRIFIFGYRVKIKNALQYGMRMRWEVHVARTRDTRNAYKILIGNPDGKRPLGIPRRRWEDNIGTDLREIGWKDVDWMHLAEDRDQW